MNRSPASARAQRPEVWQSSKLGRVLSLSMGRACQQHGRFVSVTSSSRSKRQLQVDVARPEARGHYAHNLEAPRRGGHGDRGAEAAAEHWQPASAAVPARLLA